MLLIVSVVRFDFDKLPVQKMALPVWEMAHPVWEMAHPVHSTTVYGQWTLLGSPWGFIDLMLVKKIIHL